MNGNFVMEIHDAAHEMYADGHSDNRPFLVTIARLLKEKHFKPLNLVIDYSLDDNQWRFRCDIVRI